MVEVMGSRTAIQRLVENKQVYSIGSGFYSHKKFSNFESKLYILNNYYSDYVITGAAALYLHGLISKEPEEVEVTIEDNKSFKNSLFSVKRTKKNNLSNQVEIKYKGIKSNTFSLEKILVILCRKKSDKAIFEEACKHIKNKKIKLDKSSLLKLDLDYKTNASDLIFSGSHKKLKNQKNGSTRSAIIEIGYDSYIESGFQGITMQMIADKAKISKSKLYSYFKTKTELKGAIFQHETNKLLNQAYQLDFPGSEKMSSLELVQLICHHTLENVDSKIGEKEFRFQSRVMLENHPIVNVIVKESCSKAVNLISTLIQSELKISISDAEIRATELLLAIDSYSSLRWKYISGLEISTSKSEFLNKYKEYIIKNLTVFAFQK